MPGREWTDQELFNIASLELRPNPYPAYQELLRRGAVLENPLYGVWMVRWTVALTPFVVLVPARSYAGYPAGARESS
jgi:hypothetical protein